MKIKQSILTGMGLLSLFSNSVYAQTEPSVKSPNVVVSIETKINAPADEVWAVLGKRFEEISEWTSVVESSRALDLKEIPSDYVPSPHAPVPARQTTAKNKGRTSTLIEVVTMYSDEKRELTFYGVGLPKFIDFASDRQRVIANGPNESTVVFDVEVRLTGIFTLFKGKVKKRFEENFKNVQLDLKSYVESGMSSTGNQ